MLVRACLASIDRLEADESLRVMAAVAMGTGSYEKHDRARILREWQETARPPARRRRRPPPPASPVPPPAEDRVTTGASFKVLRRPKARRPKAQEPARGD